MNKKLSGWDFNESVVGVFQQHVNQSVPGYEEMQKLIANISDFFISDLPIYDLGCATGETILQIDARHQDKQLCFEGVDISESMVLEAQKRVKMQTMNPNISIKQANLSDFHFARPTNLVLAVLTLQFCEMVQRKGILEKIYEALNPGGAFIIVEKTYAKNALYQDIYTQIYHDFKESQGISCNDIRAKDKSLRSCLTPVKASSMVEVLRGLGFEVDMFYKNLNFVGYLCVKKVAE